MLTALEALTLGLALAGPLVVGLVGSGRRSQGNHLLMLLLCQAALCALAAVCLWLTLVPLGRNPRDLGLSIPSWSTLGWGIGLAGFFIFMLGPVLLRLPRWAGLAGFEGQLNALARLPVWYLALAVLIGGATEELLYRGVGLGVLVPAGVSPIIAATLVVITFAVAHIPLWGLGPALTTGISGAALTLFFLWHGDLLANALAHVVTDFVGIVLGPLVALTRKQR